jgi:hypothetical protein
MSERGRTSRISSVAKTPVPARLAKAHEGSCLTLSSTDTLVMPVIVSVSVSTVTGFGAHVCRREGVVSGEWEIKGRRVSDEDQGATRDMRSKGRKVTKRSKGQELEGDGARGQWPMAKRTREANALMVGSCTHQAANKHMTPARASNT